MPILVCNSVSNFLESIANSIENRFECISPEDMLWNTKEFNKKMLKIKEEWKVPIRTRSALPLPSLYRGGKRN